MFFLFPEPIALIVPCIRLYSFRGIEAGRTMQNSTTSHPERKAATRESLASFNRHVALRMVFEMICGGATFIFVAYALSLGIAKENIGLVTSAVSAACLVQMIGLPFITRIVDRKRFIVRLAFIEPIVLAVAVCVIPFLSGPLRLPGLILAAFVAAACLHLSKPMLDDWIGAVLPAGLRGRYFGRRVQVMTLSGMVASPLTGLLADRFGERDTLSYALMIVVGASFGLLAAIALGRAQMPAFLTTSVTGLREIPKVLRVKAYRRYLAGLTLISLPFYFVVSYYQVMHLTVFHMSKFAIGCVLPLYGLVKLVSAPRWGRAIGRQSMRAVLLGVCPAYVALFVIYALASPTQIWLIFVGWAACGIADAAWIVCVQTALYATVPVTGSRPAFFAVYNLASLGLYGLGAALAVPLLKTMETCVVKVGPFALDQFRLFYGLAALVMVGAAFGALLFPSRSARLEMTRATPS